MAKQSLDEVKVEGTMVLLNPWMKTTKEEAAAAVSDAKKAGDDGVVAVPYAAAVASAELLEAARLAEQSLRVAGLTANYPGCIQDADRLRAAIVKAGGF